VFHQESLCLSERYRLNAVSVIGCYSMTQTRICTYISSHSFLLNMYYSAQVNDVRRETGGSHRFPVNSAVHIQNRFLCPFSASFPPIPALGKWWPYMAAVFGTVPECGSDCFLRSQDTERILPFTECGSNCFLRSQDTERILPFTESGSYDKA
jgi:hypothetical protein